MEDSEKEIEEDKSEPKVIVVESKGKGVNIKLIVILLVIIAILGFMVYKFLNKDSSSGIILRAKSTFKKAADVSELQTATFTYNGVAKRCKEECKNDGKDEYLYYVSYEGDVTAGFDFDEIDFKVDKELKKMIIILPEVKITNSHTYIDKHKFIFKNSSYDTAQELSEANRICNDDLKKRVNEDAQLLETAKDNAKVILEQFFEAWLKNYYSDYTLEVM